MSDIYIILLAAVLPAFGLMAYIYYKDEYQREPVLEMAKFFGGGVLSAFIALGLELLIGLVIPANPQTVVGAMVKAFVGAAMPEEAAKLFILCWLIRRSKYFDERFDGIVYATCVGLGFAAMENIIYLVGNANDWLNIAVGRAMFAVPGHFCFAVAMGYFLSKYYFGRRTKGKALAVYLIPVILHGTYDSLLFMQEVENMAGGMLLVAFYLFVYFLFRKGRKRIHEQLAEDASSPITMPEQPAPRQDKGRGRVLIWIILCTMLLISVLKLSLRMGEESTDPEEEEIVVVEELRQQVSYPGRSIRYSQKFNDNNPRQLTAAQANGLTPPPATREAAKQCKGQLVEVKTNKNYIIEDLTHSVPYLVPMAAARLDSIGVEWADILQRNGLPHYRFYVTSMLRTQEDIDRLQRTNGNSVKRSAHNYGTTFDIAYMRYDKVTLTNDYMTEDNLKLVLGQVLLNQQRAGAIYVKYEIQQGCFHITVRR